MHREFGLTPNYHIRESRGAKYMVTATGEFFTYAYLRECKMPFYYHPELYAIDGGTLFLYSDRLPLTDYQYSKNY